jgi:colicin import membrane protein
MLGTLTRGATRAAVDVSLRVGLAPWNAAARLTRRGPRPSPLELAVDQFDASARQLAGRLLSDDDMVDDAERRRAAVRARSTARDLHETADERAAEADREAEDLERRADETRQVVEQGAQARRKAAEKKAASRKAQAESRQRARKSTVAKSAARRKDAIGEAGRSARLSELADREEVLDAKEQALRAEDRAERLEQEAAAEKSRRS